MDILIVIIFYKGLFQYYWVQITVVWLILSIYGYTTCSIYHVDFCLWERKANEIHSQLVYSKLVSFSPLLHHRMWEFFPIHVKHSTITF